MTKWDEDIKKFREMKDGWFNGECKAPIKLAIDNADKYMHMIIDFGMKLPILYAYTKGGVVGEWEDQGYDIIFYNNGMVELTNYDESFEIIIKKIPVN